MVNCHGTYLIFWQHFTVYRTFGGFFVVVVVVQSLSCVWLFVTPWTAACQASLSFTISQSLLKLMSIESVMPSSHLILCHPFFVLPSIFPSIRVFSSELALCINGQSIGAAASASVLLMNIQGWFPLGLTDLISLQSKGLSKVFSSTTVWKHQFFSAQFSLWSSTWVSGCYLLHLRNEEPEVWSVCDLLKGIHTVNSKARTRPQIPPPTRVSCSPFCCQGIPSLPANCLSSVNPSSLSPMTSFSICWNSYFFFYKMFTVLSLMQQVFIDSDISLSVRYSLIQ